MTRALFVKICGITRQQDAELAAALGTSAVGFVLWQGSPRYVAPRAARAIGRLLPPEVLKVGVFVDEPLDDLVRIIAEAGLDAAQLHGRETPAYCEELRSRLGGESPTLIKAIAIPEHSAAAIPEFPPDVMMLVDTHDAVRRGGTGRKGNWDGARDLALARRTILAGGLNAANIRLAVRSVRPYGVDVSSGVESTPGIKDPARLRTFFEALHD